MIIQIYKANGTGEKQPHGFEILVESSDEADNLVSSLQSDFFRHRSYLDTIRGAVTIFSWESV
jgi:hypothetical protein